MTRKSSSSSAAAAAANSSSSSVIDGAIIRALYPPSRVTTTNTAATAAGSLSSGGEEGRFTQLLLEHGERHLQDWAVLASSSEEDERKTASSSSSSLSDSARTASFRSGSRSSLGSGADDFPSCSLKRLEGRLRLCSRSVVWEPSDMSRGIIRCPFAKLLGPPSCGGGGKEVVISTTRHFVMKANNRIEPFLCIDRPVRFTFTFRHSTPQPFLELSKTLFDISIQNGSGTGGGGGGGSDAALDALLRPMLDRPMDPSNFVDLREVPQTSNLKCCMLVPLMRKPGCCVVTSERMYFQPANAGVFTKIPTRSQHWHLKEDVVAVARRYDGLRDCALELFLQSAPSVLISLEGWREREEVLSWLQHVPCLTDRSFVRCAMTEWCRGALDNFDYLLMLNAAAGRSFQDLSRYPVFPWVVADYDSPKLDLASPLCFRDLTKPVGALDAGRLENFRRRMESMSDVVQDAPFLYGTHFSAPGYVLFFLVRCMPQHMLCLQNGKFDHPDRLFHSMRHCWNSVLKNPADVKELIPEFYFPQGGFDFLVNAMGLNLGNTQRGDRVYDVALPPWAKSPRDFLRKNRKALESEWCTSTLPRWIDLIFGCTSRGEAALEADNVFAPTAYLGPADWEALELEEARLQAELQATEFGIHPDVLFVQPHAARGSVPSRNVVGNEAPGRAMDPNDYVGTAAAAATTATTTTIISATKGPFSETEKLEAPLDGQPSPLPTNKSMANGGAGAGRSRSQSDAQNWEFLEEPPPTNTVAAADGSASSFVDLPPMKHHYANGNHRHSNNMEEGGERRPENGKPRISLSGSGENIRSRRPGGFLVKTTTTTTTLASAWSMASTPTRTIHNAASAPSPSTPAKPSEWTIKPLAPRLSPHGDSVSGCSLHLARSRGGVGDEEEAEEEEDDEKNPSLVTTVSLDGQLMVHTLPRMTNDGEERRTFEDERSAFMSRLPYLGLTGASTSDLGASVGDLLYGSSSSSTYNNNNNKPRKKLTLLRSHAASEPLACVQLVADPHGGLVAFAGGHDDVVVAYGIHSACALASLYSHRDAVTGIDFLKWQGAEMYVMMTASWDGTVKVWSVSLARGETVSMVREPLVELFDAESSVLSVAATNLAGDDEFLIAAACADGTLLLWACRPESGEKQLLLKEEARRGSGECTSVGWGGGGGGGGGESDTKTLFVGYASGRVSCFLYDDAGSIRPTSRVSLGSAVNCLATAEQVVLAGCADGSLCLLPVSEGAYLDVNPTVWKLVHGGSGITSVDLRACDKEGKFVCATGGDDGSLLVQQLQRAGIE